MPEDREAAAVEALDPCAAAFLPEEGGPATLLRDRGAAPGAGDALRALTHREVRAAMPPDAFDEDGLAVDARPLLPGVEAPLRAVRRVPGGFVVLLAWGPDIRGVPLEAAFEALRPSPPLPFEDIFENAALAMTVVGGDRRVHAANRAGRRLLERSRVLGLSDGLLRAATPHGDRRLGAALEEASGLRKPVAVQIASASGTGRLRCELGRIDRPVAPGGEAARILLTVAPANAEAPIERLLAERFGLTSAEARLAGHLAAGRDLRSAGEAMGVSRHTARKYLQIAFSKMGVRRQADLVRRALQIAQEEAD